MVQKRKFENTTDQSNRSEVVPIITILELGDKLTKKLTLKDKEKNPYHTEIGVLQNGFYFQLLNNCEILDIHYIFEGTVLTSFFNRITITRNDKLKCLNIILYDENNKVVDNHQIGPYFKDSDGNITNSSHEKNSNPLGETIQHLVSLQLRFW